MKDNFTKWEKAWAWGVHLFTATGVLTVFMAILAVSDGDFQGAMFWLLAAQVIDGADGTLARRFRVTEVLPHMSGKNIDFVIDFAAYAIVPAYLIYAAQLINGPWNLACTFLILMVSAVYYGKDGMVSDDHYFIGFPVMWNMAAFYMVFVFRWPHEANIVFVFLLSVLHFIPIKYAYPSRNGQWRGLTWAMTIAFAASFVGIVYLYPEQSLVLNVLAVAAMVYFAFFAIWVTYVRP